MTDLTKHLIAGHEIVKDIVKAAIDPIVTI